VAAVAVTLLAVTLLAVTLATVALVSVALACGAGCIACEPVPHNSRPSRAVADRECMGLS
jgi:hypothetical protein